MAAPGVRLGKVLVNGRDAGLDQIELGLAWHYKKYERSQSALDRQTYAAAEEVARLGWKGVLKDSDPVLPREFRKNQRCN